MTTLYQLDIIVLLHHYTQPFGHRQQVVESLHLRHHCSEVFDALMLMIRFVYEFSPYWNDRCSKTKLFSLPFFLAQDIGTKHVYLTPRAFDHGSGSSRSIDESNNASPQTPVYAIGSNRSVRDSDLDANTNSPKHVYAFQ